MKALTLIAIVLALLPNVSFAETASATRARRLIEAKAVVQSLEIRTLLAVEKKAHQLKCEPMAAKDVVITEDAAMDSFEIAYGCNDAKGGANVQRIKFTGGVYTEGRGSQTADVVVTGMNIELSE